MTYFDFLRNSLEKASIIAREKYGHVSSIEKNGDPHQILTQADLQIGTMLIAEIEKQFATHNIIDEEKGVIDKKSKYTWVIDPIDGTSNFASGIPTYGIYLGLLRDDLPIAGAIALPSFSEIYIAQKNKGTWCSGKRVFVTPESDMSKLLIAYGMDGYPQGREENRRECLLLAELLPHVRNIRMSNSAFDGAMVARGSYGAWLCTSSKIWDNVALHCVIEEAGGIYTDLLGRPITYKNALRRLSENFTYCIGAPAIHRQIQEIIKKGL